MCIRDSSILRGLGLPFENADRLLGRVIAHAAFVPGQQAQACLLYTSDAADERSSVDLGGRRIIKKKKTREMLRATQALVIESITT